MVQILPVRSLTSSAKDVLSSSNPSMTSVAENSEPGICHYHIYNGPSPELINILSSKNTPTPVDYHRELLIRGIIEHDKDDETQPGDWKKLQAHLNAEEDPKDVDAFYIRGARRVLNLAHVKDLDVVLASLLSSVGALYDRDGSVKVCLREKWRTIPLPWRGSWASDLPTPCPDLTFGHGRGMDLIPGRLPRLVSPFFTPVEEEPHLMLPCVTVQVKGNDDEHIKRTNQHAAAIMLRNMAELSLTTKPSRLIREMLGLENRVSVLTVSVLKSSLVLTCHWLMRHPVMGHLEYHSRDMKSWDLDDTKQKEEALNRIFKAIQWVLNRNRPWVIEKVQLIMADGGL
ncbi:hypothetical protein P170DRAFT_441419 [Aspergillus steynii IBT 23096]|uniref:DUF7924 domain-containing protein n=1 Tax=Aspergillus steynii IBT 23096 TaxID=1392250 RepID=A0A2I2FTL6_9EURO|nr:uncharacterized protein P170DRAFT_441419 [Aspergillus steynii IBT 23096]PLB43983.1 hypothetical protein P170DRAFT_441419 [Aspergillus steynii IBT 23096]